MTGPIPGPIPGPIADDVVAAYVAGTLGEAEALRVEHAVLVDPAARRQVNDVSAAALGAERLDLAWFGIEVGLAPPRRGWLERAVVRCGLPADLARLMAATPSMRRSWLLAAAGALLFGLAAASPDRADGTAGSTFLFLVLAPLVPVMGVALAYGPGVDPAHEVTVAAPVSGARLVLVRTLAVLSLSIGAGGLGALLLRRREGIDAAAWLLPALGLSATCLALTTFVRPRTAGWTVGGAWIAVAVLASGGGAADVVLFRPGGQIAMAVLAIVGAVVTVVRRRRFDVVVAS